MPGAWSKLGISGSSKGVSSEVLCVKTGHRNMGSGGERMMMFQSEGTMRTFVVIHWSHQGKAFDLYVSWYRRNKDKGTLVLGGKE